MRRSLSFTSLPEVIPDVRRLLAGHVMHGQWSLGMMCQHLCRAFELSMEGFPEQASWIYRRTVGVVARQVVLRVGWIPRGVKAPGMRLMKDHFDPALEAERLAEAIERFSAYSGKLAEHPMLGRFSKKQWVRFHCVHCAHHLSFADCR